MSTKQEVFDELLEESRDIQLCETWLDEQRQRINDWCDAFARRYKEAS